MPTPLQLALLSIVAWLPGAALFRGRWLEVDRRASLDPEERWFWQVILSVAVSLAIAMLLAVFGLYTFERLLAADVLVALGIAAAARFRLRMPHPKRIGFGVAVPVALILLGAWRFFPPSEYVLGGKDPGTYMNEGIQIAQRGGLVIRDETIAAVPPAFRDLFFPSHQNPHYYSLRFMGFFIQDPREGLVVGQFPHLFPISIAVGYGIAGLTGARCAVGFWGVLGLLSVYFLGARLIGRTAAAATATLLALHVLQVWYARYPNAEIMMQALLFAALLATDRALQNDCRFFAPVAGVLLGMQVALRVDIALAIVAVAAAIALSIARGRAVPWSLIVPASILSLGGLWYLIELLPGYAYYPVGFTRDWVLAPLLLCATATLGVVLWVRRRPSRVRMFERLAPGGLIALVLFLSAYGWIFRTASGKTAMHDAEAMRTFVAFYFTPAAFLAALGGFVFLVARGFWRAPASLLTLTAFAWFFFYKIRVVPEHFWMGRRLIPVILPGVLLLASGFALSGLTSASRPRRLIASALGLVFLVMLGARYARVTQPVMGHVEYAGLIPQLETLSKEFSDDDLVVIEARDASDIHVLGLPLTYIYARKTLLLASALPDKALFASFLEWAATRYRRVLFLGSGGTDLLSRRWSLRPEASAQFRVPEYEQTAWNVFPRLVRQKEFEYGIYEFGPPQPSSEQIFDLDIGTADDLHVVRFHSKEQTEGRSFRWTRYNSQIAVTPFHADGRTVTIWMSDGGRPDAAEPAEVRVFLLDHLLGTAVVQTGFRPYTFSIPPEVASAAIAADPPRLRLQTNLWRPSEVLGSGDDRELGVMLDRVLIR